MELKLVIGGNTSYRDNLLIVPYGIETSYPLYQLHQVLLLIVPYGIETRKRCRVFGYSRLLIVPYGIETLREVP